VRGRGRKQAADKVKGMYMHGNCTAQLRKQRKQQIKRREHTYSHCVKDGSIRGNGISIIGGLEREKERKREAELS